jgi:hypothetical protein
MTSIATPLTQRRRRPGLLVQAGVVMIGLLGLGLWLVGGLSGGLSAASSGHRPSQLPQQARADGPADAAGSAVSVPAAQPADLPVEVRRPGAQPLLRLQIVSRCAGFDPACAATLAMAAVTMPGMNPQLDVSMPGGWAA